MKFLDLLVSLAPLQWALPSHPYFPKPDFSRFEVNDLPDNPSSGRNWAGQIDVPGTEIGNSLFFWLFEAQDLAYQDNLIIWLNGGPGCSSLIGMGTANGPWTFGGVGNGSTMNPFSWTKLANILYVDQPAGSGLSTSSTPYPVNDNRRVTSDFYAWLRAFYRHFPHLLSKKLHIMGESYAGVYIPYFATEIMENRHKLPVNLKSISLGDGSFGNFAAMGPVSVVKYMQSQRTILDISNEHIAAFSSAAEKCGFEEVLQQATAYSPVGPILVPGDPEHLNHRRSVEPEANISSDATSKGCNIHPTTPSEIQKSIHSSTCYGPCATFSTALDFLTTRAAQISACFDIYNIKSNCTTVDPLSNLESYLSRADVQSALHITGSPVNYKACNSTILETLLAQGYVEPPAYRLIPTLLNTHHIAVHIYEGDLDMLINHIGIELVLQNMTWKGKQGFSQKPDKPFMGRRPRGWQTRYGTWGAERGLSYHLFEGAGHEVPKDMKEAMWMFVRDFVVGFGGYESGTIWA